MPVTIAAPNERRAYAALLLGAQRGDYLRVLLLKYLGGVFADLDTRLVAPLRSVIPPEASGLTGGKWSWEFLVYEPGHPILVRALSLMTAAISAQVEAHRTGNGCKGANACVMGVTGPGVYRFAVRQVTNASGCFKRGDFMLKRICRSSTDPAFARTYVCERDIGTAGACPFETRRR